MMLALVANIAFDLCDDGFIDGKRAVTILPMELQCRVSFFIDVLARTRFQLPDKIGDRDFGGNAKQ